VGAAIFDIRIAGNFVWFSAVLCTLKEEKQDASHIFLHKKKANEIVNLAHLSIFRLRYYK
jgi:hypothetical protein